MTKLISHISKDNKECHYFPKLTFVDYETAYDSLN